MDTIAPQVQEKVESVMKQIVIDFLYLDLSTCERCMATDDTLKEALNVLSGVFDTLDYRVQVNSVNITSKALAEEYRFVSSPTIRVNGVDICNEVIESDCTDCGDLCGDTVDCRVFIYEGKEYEQPLVAMIADGILKVIYRQKPFEHIPYTLPDNLDRFFTGKSSCCDSGCACDDIQTNNQLRSDFSMKTMSIYEPAMCCETGICGVSVDPELLRISTVFNKLQKNGVAAARFNLSSAPQAFINNVEINKLINGEGVEALPATVIDGEIVKTKAYPTNEEIVALLGIPAGYLEDSEDNAATATESSCCDCDSGCC